MTSDIGGEVMPDEAVLGERRVAPGRAVDLLDGTRTVHGRFGSRPLRYGIGFGLSIFVLTTFGGAVLGQGLATLTGHAGLQDEAGALGTDVLGALSVIVLLSSLGWWGRVGFGGPKTWTDLRLLIFPAVFALVPLLDGIADADLEGAGRMALTLPQPFLTGFWEEGLIRGFLFYCVSVAVLRAGRSPTAAVLWSAAAFGALHAIAIVGGADPGAVLTQVCYAALLGVGFGAVLLRTNALWLLVLIHGVFNIGSALTTSTSTGGFSIGPVLLCLPLALYGVFLLRRRRGGRGGRNRPRPTAT